jgi:hypothetical protein
LGYSVSKTTRILSEFLFLSKIYLFFLLHLSKIYLFFLLQNLQPANNTFSLSTMDRSKYIPTILEAKCHKKMTWGSIAQAIGRSDVWTISACYGQATMSRDEAAALGKVLDLPDEVVCSLQQMPWRG